MPILLGLALWASGANAGLIEIRTYDGTGNNESHPDWGAAGITLLRMAPADYPDGTGSEMIQDQRANPRGISNAIAAFVDGAPANSHGMTSFAWQWGQFIDHDLDLTGVHADNGTADIEVTNEPSGDPLAPGPIPFTRSNFDGSSGVRQQINEITAFIDGSMIYGSDETTANSLRASGG